jgi:hypothetical protein
MAADPRPLALSELIETASGPLSRAERVSILTIVALTLALGILAGVSLH